VRRGSSAGKGITFYLLIGMLLIAFMNSRCYEIVFSLQCSVFSKNFVDIAKALAICGSNLFVAAEQMKNDTLAGFLVLWVLQVALSIGKSYITKPLAALTKAMQILTAFGVRGFFT